MNVFANDANIMIFKQDCMFLFSNDIGGGEVPQPSIGHLGTSRGLSAGLTAYHSGTLDFPTLRIFLWVF